MTAVLSTEALHLQLIQGTGTHSSNQNPPLSDEAVQNLIKALEFADKTLSHDIETALVHLGSTDQSIIQHLLQGILSHSPAIQGTCAMALIRIGQPAVQSLQAFAKQPESAAIQWAIDFLFTELAAEKYQTQRQVLSAVCA